MNLISYLDKIIYVTLFNGFYYSGKCVEADENSITLIDKRNLRVSLTKDSISTIREVSK